MIIIFFRRIVSIDTDLLKRGASRTKTDLFKMAPSRISAWTFILNLDLKPQLMIFLLLWQFCRCGIPLS